MTKKHSVLLKEEKCEGCTNCVKGCLTKAIRVHQGRAWIKEDLCIDCAECIRACEYHAKYTETDSLAHILANDFPVLLIPPSFYSQFPAEIAAYKIKAALKDLGFKAVYDVAEAAAALSRKTLKFLNNNPGSYISSSCPVIVRLIKLQFPELIEMLIPLKSPVELTAEKLKRKYRKIENIEADIFFLTPCPAKLTTVERPVGQKESFLSGAVGVENLYQKIYDKLNKQKETAAEAKTEAKIGAQIEDEAGAKVKTETETKVEAESEIKAENKAEFEIELPSLATIWGSEGGEKNILSSWQEIKTLSVSGLKEVKALLSEIERNNISDEIKYFEVTSCSSGCIGGVLNVINNFQAEFNLEERIKKIKALGQKYNLETEAAADKEYNFALSEAIKADNVSKLDQDFKKAMQKLERMQQEIKLLPGLDCAACGAPDCETFAEDIVNGRANRSDCIFMLRKQLGQLADDLSLLAHELPPVMGKPEEDKDES